MKRFIKNKSLLYCMVPQNPNLKVELSRMEHSGVIGNIVGSIEAVCGAPTIYVAKISGLSDKYQTHHSDTRTGLLDQIMSILTATKLRRLDVVVDSAFLESGSEQITDEEYIFRDIKQMFMAYGESKGIDVNVQYPIAEEINIRKNS